MQILEKYSGSTPILPIKSLYCGNIGITLRIFPMKQQYFRNIVFAMEIFLIKRQYREVMTIHRKYFFNETVIFHNSFTIEIFLIKRQYRRNNSNASDIFPLRKKYLTNIAIKIFFINRQ